METHLSQVDALNFDYVCSSGSLAGNTPTGTPHSQAQGRASEAGTPYSIAESALSQFEPGRAVTPNAYPGLFVENQPFTDKKMQVMTSRAVLYTCLVATSRETAAAVFLGSMLHARVVPGPKPRTLKESLVIRPMS